MIRPSNLNQVFYVFSSKVLFIYDCPVLRSPFGCETAISSAWSSQVRQRLTVCMAKTGKGSTVEARFESNPRFFEIPENSNQT